MRTILKSGICLLLVFNGTAALYGGWNLMAYPDGSSLDMPISYLRYGPFTSYLIPGLILFVVNGIQSFFTLIITLFEKIEPYRLIVVQGCLLTGWIVVESLLMWTISGLHLVFGLTGILLIIGGKAFPSTGHKIHRVSKQLTRQN
jgi:hypothetical protein